MDPSTRGGVCKAIAKLPTPGDVQHLQGDDRDDWYIRVLDEAGLNRLTWRPGTARFLQAAEWILHDTGQYKLIGLHGSIGGHAVAVHLGSDGPTFMDPNLGELKFPAPGNFMTFFPKFVRLYTAKDSPTSPVKKFDWVIVRNFGHTRARP